MSRLKGYCVKCKNVSDADRVFEINSSAKNCFCPRCLSSYEPTEAAKLYEHTLERQISFALRKFLHENDFFNAYNSFAHVIELDNEYVPAYLWRIVCLICLSTLRRAMFVEANELFVSEMKIFEKNDNTDLLTLFVTRLINSTSFYLNQFKNKTTFKNYFYEVECLSQYYQRVNEILALFENVRILFDNIIATKNISKFKQTQRLLDLKIKDYSNILKYEYAVVDGSVYKLARFMPEGQAIISKEKSIRQLKIPPRMIKTLNNKDKNKVIIDDDIFGKYHRLYRTKIFDFSTYPIAFVSSASLFTLMILNLNTDYFWIVFMISAIVLFIIGIITFIHSFYALHLCKKIKKWLF